MHETHPQVFTDMQEVAFGAEEEQRHNFCSTGPKHDVRLQEAGLHVTLQLQDAEVSVPNVHQKAWAHSKSSPYQGCAATSKLLLTCSQVLSPSAVQIFLKGLSLAH